MKPEKEERQDRVNGNLVLIQKIRGLTFGTDAYLLYAYMRPKPGGVAVELGAGSGIISFLALTGKKFLHIHCVEIQAAYAGLIARNAAQNGLSDRVTIHARDLRGMTAKEIAREADVVFANPPYMPAGCGRANRDEEKFIARHEVFGGIGDFCKAAFRLLRHGGSFYLVYRPDRLSDLLFALRTSGFEVKRMTFVHADCLHRPSLLLLEAKKGAKAGLYLTKPLFLYETDEKKGDRTGGEKDAADAAGAIMCRADRERARLRAGAYAEEEFSETNKKCGQASREPTDDIRYIYDNGAFPVSFERPRGGSR